MEHSRIRSIEFKIWNRKIINGYWLVSFLYLIGQVIFLVLDKLADPNYSVSRFLVKYMLIPDSLLIFILLATELCFRYTKRLEKYLIIITSIVMAFTIYLNINYTVAGRQLVLIVPILISTFYFDKKILAYTCLAITVIFIMLYVLFPYQRQVVSIYEVIVVTFACISSSIVSIGVVSRGIELLDSITSLVKNEEKLIVEKSLIDKLSKTDALTGLYNHRTFHGYTDTLLEQHCYYGLPLQLAIVDIDNFKKVNDTFGHWTGDIVLKEVASIIHSSITADDFVARYGGEEFAIIFIGKNFEETVAILEKIRTGIQAHKFKEIEYKSVTVSIGIHDYLKSEGKEALFKYADSALYKAKSTGKNKVVYANKDSD